jgi:DNA-binding beta-propeller fold protein YncE
MKSRYLLPAFLTAVATAAPLDIRVVSSLPLAGAEISAFDPASDRIFITCSTGLQIVDISSPATPALVTTVDFTTFGLPSTDITSVTVHGGKVAVAIPDPVKSAKGRVAFLNAADGVFLGSVEVGALPDMLTFTPDGSKVLVANEGEIVSTVPDTAEGSVSIIDVSAGFTAPPVTTAGFAAFDSQAQALRDAGVRIFQNGVPSTDFEPEYIAVAPDGATAMVTLQEANAVAILNIATATFTSVVPLGQKDFRNLYADFSDRDGPGNSAMTNLTTGNPVYGLYMPDSIASFAANGQTYYVIANEGDDRDDFLTETTRVGSGSYVLDPGVFPDAAVLKTNARLGRLTVSNSPGLRGDTDGDGDIDRILAYGVRSFSVLNSSGAIVYDSGDLIERATATFGTPWFDDTRSDNKAAEPEGITVGEVAGRHYVFVGLERSRGVMAFDVTDPANVSMAGFGTRPEDENPEGITFISAGNSPSGAPMLAVTNEVSNTLTLYSLAASPYAASLSALPVDEAGLLASRFSIEIESSRSTGRSQVTGNPGSFGLYTPSSIQDLRGVGNLMVRAEGNDVNLTLPLQKSTNLESWQPAGEFKATLLKTGDKEFYRVILPH